MGAEKALDSVHPCRHRRTSTLWYGSREGLGADIDNDLKFGLRLHLHPYSLYGNSECSGKYAPMLA